MKKQSIAEQTLNKQIVAIEGDIAAVLEEQRSISQRITTLVGVRDRLTAEHDKLKQQRQDASESRKK